MSYPTPTLDRAAVVEQMQGRWEGIYSDFVELNGTGPERKALCPFHDDHNPSLSISMESGWYKCFACGAKGDGFTFLKEREGLPFRDALLRLADYAGIPNVSKLSSGNPSSNPKPSPSAKSKKQELGPIVAEYTYLDAEGNVSFQVTRHDPKTFRQRRPAQPNEKYLKADGQHEYARRDETGRWWFNSLGGLPLETLYHLPDVLTAVQGEKPVFLCEGEKDADRLRALGLTATTAPMGAKKTAKQWLPRYTEALKGANVVIMEDNDPAGRIHVQIVAAALHGQARQVRVVSLPGLPEDGDVSNFLDAGVPPAELMQIVNETPEWTPEPECETPESNKTGTKKADTEEKAEKGPSTAEFLVQLGTQAKLFHSDRDEGFVSFQTAEHTEHRPLRSKPFRDYLSREFYLNTGKPPNAQAMEDALRVLEGMARFDGPERPLSVRTAWQGISLWIDLGDREWRAVRVTADSWQVECDPPPLFRRYAATAAHVEPRTGGDLSLLRSFLNVRDDGAWYQLVVWLVAAFLPDIAHPVLVVHGEQGSAKSSLMRMLSLLVDPSKTPLRTEPRDVAEWVQTADHCALVTLDNVSHLPGWLSDAICRAVTGEGFVKRQLFTDAEDVVIAFRRVIALTGIEVVAQRADLLDRALLMPLEPIMPDKRRLETEVLAAFEQVRPLIFGALLDTLVGVLRELPAVHLTTMPRMADFARVGVAVERALGWPENTFITAYDSNVAEQHQEALSSSIIGDALIALTDKRGGRWEGTAKELLEALATHVGENTVKRREWPKSAKSLGGMVRRVAPNLRAVGLDVEFTRNKSKRMITLVKGAGLREVTQTDVTDVTLSPDTPSASENGSERVTQQGDIGDANQAGVTQINGAEPVLASHDDGNDMGDANSALLSDDFDEELL